MSGRACVICGKALAPNAHRLQRICGARACYLERKRRRRDPEDARRRSRVKAKAERKALSLDPYVPEHLRDAARLVMSAPWDVPAEEASP